MLGRFVLAEVDEMFDEHAERSTPVADVVLADHFVTHELEHPHQGVADDRAAQVPDVHLLGHVRSRVVDDHLASARSRPHAETIAGRNVGDLVGEKRTIDDDVHETRTGDLERAANVAPTPGLGHHRFGDVAR